MTLTETPAATDRPPVQPHRLLRRAEPPRVGNDRLSVRLARGAVTRLLRRMARDRLTIVDDTRSGSPTTTYGQDAPGSPSILQATIRVRDDRAWTALATEGSIGLGRGYLEGWWDSADPVTVVRIIIRNLEGSDEVRNRINARTGWATNRIRGLLPRPDRTRNKDDIASHYDLGNDFFDLFLDETMSYSAAVFPSPHVDLAEASAHKCDRLFAKLGLEAEHHLLEIGTGWGGLALRAAERVGCRVTTTTISDEQFTEARRRIGAAGLGNSVTLLDSDWRDLEGRHDRIVSVEMIEAVDWRDYDDFFATIERCLEPDGLVAIQAICVPDRRYERTKNTEDFIRRFIFPGGFLPSVGAISRSTAKATRLQIVDVEDLSAHYAETLRRWRDRFELRLDDAAALGLDERFCRLWRFYLAYCEAAFTERHCTVNQIVLAGPRWRPDGTTLRPV
jgi:cyclopropane-fatty-acyl-phospholipid synthase